VNKKDGGSVRFSPLKFTLFLGRKTAFSEQSTIAAFEAGQKKIEDPNRCIQQHEHFVIL
jgi:hypothetical protein